MKKTLRYTEKKKNYKLHLFMLLFLIGGLFSLWALLPLTGNNITNYAILTFSQEIPGDAGDTDNTTYFFRNDNVDQTIISYDVANPTEGKTPTIDDLAEPTGFDILINDLVNPGDFDRNLDSLSTYGIKFTEVDLSDSSTLWTTDTLPFNKGYIDFSRGRFKLSSAPRSSTIKTNIISVQDSQVAPERCWVQWGDNLATANIVETNGEFDGDYIRLSNADFTEGTYYYINQSNVTGYDGDPLKSSLQLITVNQATGSTTGYGECAYIPPVVSQGEFIFPTWEPTYTDVSVTYRTYEDQEGPIAPTLWYEKERATNNTIQIIGYTNEANVVVHTDLIQDHEPYDYKLYNLTTTQEANLTLKTNVTHRDITKGSKEFFIPLNNITKDAVTISPYVEFIGFNKSYFVHYTIDSYTEVSGVIRLETNEEIEDDIPMGTVVQFYDNKYPTGWFNQTVELFDDRTEITVYGEDSEGNDGDVTRTFRTYYPETIIINISTPADNAILNNIKNLEVNFTPISNKTELINCSLSLNDILITEDQIRNNTPTTFLIQGLETGDYYWDITCHDDHYFTTPYRNFSIIDTIAPIITPRFNKYINDTNITLPFNITDLVGINMDSLEISLTPDEPGLTEPLYFYDIYNDSVSCTGVDTEQTCEVEFLNLSEIKYNLTISIKDIENQERIYTKIIGSDITQPNVSTILSEQVPYTNSKNISANWTCTDGFAGIEKAYYAIGSENNEADIINWTEIQSNSTALTHFFEINETHLNLMDRTPYYVSVRCQDYATLKSETRKSMPILFVDITAPNSPIVIDEGMYTSSNTHLFFNWTSFDEESKLHHYEVQLGEVGMPGSIFPWLDVGLNTSQSFIHSIYEDGKNYSLQVRAYSDNGQISTIGESNGIVVDSTPSINGSVSYAPATNSTENIIYYDVGNDSISPIKSARLHIFKSELRNENQMTVCNGDFLEVTNFGVPLNETNITVNLANDCYKFVLKVMNEADLVKEYNTPQILKLDATAPESVSINDYGIYRSDHSLKFTINSEDQESQITEYNISLGSQLPGRDDLFDWKTYTTTNATSEVTIFLNESELKTKLVNGEIYFLNVIAKNLVNLTTDIVSSDGIVWLDLDNPITSFAEFEGEVINGSQPMYYDTNGDNFTSIIINTENDTVCKVYEEDVNYQLNSGDSCQLIPGSDYLRNCLLYLPYEGEYTRHISCKDQLDNQQTSDSNLDISFIVDHKPPKVTYLNPIQGDFLSPNFILQTTIIDQGIKNITDANYSLIRKSNNDVIVQGALIDKYNQTKNESDKSHFEANISINQGTAPEGEYIFTITATDAANQTADTSINVSIDWESPTIDIYDLQSKVFNNDFILNGIVTDRNIKRIEYYIKGYLDNIIYFNETRENLSSEVEYITNNINISSYNDAVYHLEIIAEDYNNHTTKKTIPFKIDTTNPQLTSISYPTEINRTLETFYLNYSWEDNMQLDTIEVFKRLENSTLKSVKKTTLQNTTQAYAGSYGIDTSNSYPGEVLEYQVCAEDHAQNKNCSTIINITAINVPPQINKEFDGRIAMDEDTTKYIFVNETFIDYEESMLTYKLVNVTNNTFINVTLDNDTLIIKPEKNWNGVSFITVSADDNISSTPTYFTYTITVNPVNDLPELVKGIPTIGVTDNRTTVYLNMTQYFTDPEQDKLYYSAGNYSPVLNISFVQIENDLFAKITRLNESIMGRFEFTINVNDYENQISQKGIITYLDNTTMDIRDIYVKNEIGIKGYNIDILFNYLTLYNVSTMSATITKPDLSEEIIPLSYINLPFNYNEMNISYNNTDLIGEYMITPKIIDKNGNVKSFTKYFRIYNPITQTIIIN